MEHGIFGALVPLLARYGYLAIFGVIGVESFGVPAPGQTLLIAAAVYAGTGRLNIVWVAVVAFLAAVIGDNIGYLIGRLGGRRLVHRFGRYVLLSEKRLAHVEGVFERHGGKLVVIARFVDGLRQFNGVVAGIAGMKWSHFLACNALGAALWVALWTSAGRIAGRHVGAIYAHARHYQVYLLIALGVIIVALLTRYLLRRSRRRAARAEQTEQTEETDKADETEETEETGEPSPEPSREPSTE